MSSIHIRNDELRDLIIRFRGGDESAFFCIFDVFNKLILKYSHKVNGEDTAQDLSLFLLELIHNISLERFASDDSDTLQRYIAVCLKHKYIELSKENQSQAVLLDDTRSVDTDYTPNLCDNFELAESLKLLSDKQKMVIVYRYVYGYSIDEIAARLNITRQATNQIKNRAIKNLQAIYC